MTMQDEPTNKPFVYKYEFFRKEFSIEDKIEASTESLCRDGKLGRRARDIYHNLDGALLSLAQLASCHWGCRGGEHIQENLVRRLVNYSLASIRLAKLGLYDESLAMLRSLAELANLLELFTVSAETLPEWLELSPKERWKKFGVKSVEERIRKTGNLPIVDRDTYRKLCALGVHVIPASLTTSHQFDGSVHVGGSFSVPAFLLIINELSIVLGACLKLSVHLFGLKQPAAELLAKTGAELEGSATSWIRARNYEEILVEFQSSRSSAN